MTSKERVMTTMDFREPDRVPGWLGASPEFINKAIEEFGLKNEEDLRQMLGDDFRRVLAPYVHPDAAESDNTPFGIARDGIGYGIALSHPLGKADLDEVRAYNWPDPGCVDISRYRVEAEKHYDEYAILGGDWCAFWHDLIDILGMENLFIKMYMDPELVEYAIGRIVDYYMEVNARIFEEAADLIDIFFIGNDFGSATGPQIDVGLFDQFVVPQLKRLTGLGHSYGKKVMLHCCGGFRELIPSMIESGLDGVHAIQPSCRGMELRKLKQDFGDKIVFNGCIDSHHVIIQGTPDHVQRETMRTLDIMKPGGGFIAGASHDYILEETPAENIRVMFETINSYGKY